MSILELAFLIIKYTLLDVVISNVHAYVSSRRAFTRIISHLMFWPAKGCSGGLVRSEEGMNLLVGLSASLIHGFISKPWRTPNRWHNRGTLLNHVPSLLNLVLLARMKPSEGCCMIHLAQGLVYISRRVRWRLRRRAVCYETRCRQVQNGTVRTNALPSW